jgi:hypothetical protein
LLGDFAQDVPSPYGKHWHGILFRKTYKQLEELISRSKEIYPPWFPGAKWSNSDVMWSWPNGAMLKMRHMDSDDDWLEYWGHSYTWMGWDELGNWASSIPYLRMKARLRCAQHPIPNMRIRSSANPGGPGHQWVKAYFRIDQYPMGGVIFDAPDDSGTKRLYVKSRLTDNKIGMVNDPKYAARLNGLGSEQYVRALKDGDWNVIAGAFFPEFSVDRHLIEPFEIPAHWARIRMGDWGSAKPFAILWAAVSDGSLEHIARGALVIYREWYGWNGEPNVGCKLTSQEIGLGIKLIERGQSLQLKFDQPPNPALWPALDITRPLEPMADEVLDPSAFTRDGGPSHAERMDLNWRRADNSRVPKAGAASGWDELRNRLKGDEDGPQLLIFLTCPHLIRTLPALQHDPHKAEDVDTNGEDHAPDALRYGCMSRPMVRDKPSNKPVLFETDLTINDLIKRAKQKRLAES